MIRKEKFLFTTGLVDIGTKCIFRFNKDMFYESPRKDDWWDSDSDEDDQKIREETIDENIAIIKNIGLEKIELSSHRTNTPQYCGTRSFKGNSSIINTTPIFDIKSGIIMDFMKLEWIFLVQPYITKIHMNSLACCCKKLNAYITQQTFYFSYDMPIMPHKNFDECTFCGKIVRITTGENCKDDFVACDKCIKLYKVPICVSTILTVEKSRIFPYKDQWTPDCKPIMVPDSYVCHLEDIISSKYEYWKLAINCVNFALGKDIYNPKWCKIENCTNTKVGHLINFLHKKKL